MAHKQPSVQRGAKTETGHKAPIRGLRSLGHQLSAVE